MMSLFNKLQFHGRFHCTNHLCQIKQDKCVHIDQPVIKSLSRVASLSHIILTYFSPKVGPDTTGISVFA
jgi:hypothetical protein